MTIGPINDLNPNLPAVPTGALLVPAAGTTPSYYLVTGSIVTNPGSCSAAAAGIAALAARHCLGLYTVQGKNLTIIQQLAILHTVFDHDDASIRPIGCCYSLPCNAPWARTCRTEVRSLDGEIRRPAMKLQYGSLWKPAFR
jgi:hypothetical protein